MTAVPNRVRKLALELFGRLPGRLRRLVVQLLTPHYVLGAVLVLRHEDNILFVRSRHTRAGWSLPGGLMQRGETPRDAIRREVCEELGLDIEVDEQPTFTLVDPACRRVDLVFEIPVAVPPPVRVDGTEAVAACWLPTGTELEDPTAVATMEALLSRDGDGLSRDRDGDRPREVVLPDTPAVAVADAAR